MPLIRYKIKDLTTLLFTEVDANYVPRPGEFIRLSDNAALRVLRVEHVLIDTTAKLVVYVREDDSGFQGHLT